MTITATFYAKKRIGDLDIDLQKLDFSLGEIGITSDSQRQDQKLKYKIRPEIHSLEMGPTVWNVNGQQVQSSPLTATVSPHDVLVKFPPIRLTSSSGIEALVSGSFSEELKQADLSCILEKIPLDGVEFDGQSLPLSGHYDKGLTINVFDSHTFNYKKIPIPPITQIKGAGDRDDTRSLDLNPLK